MIELYHFWSSVCSVRCRMVLEEKGVSWTSRYIDLFKFDQLRPEYLAINPDGVVPTLVHDGVPIRESTVINEYIDAAFQGPKLCRFSAAGNDKLTPRSVGRRPKSAKARNRVERQSAGRAAGGPCRTTSMGIWARERGWRGERETRAEAFW
jgi:glutathione S-transferase